MIPLLILMLSSLAIGQAIDPSPIRDPRTRPARIKVEDLSELEMLSAGRKRLIGIALAVAQESPWLPYVVGGADPTMGGFDCSGAMHYVMRKAGLRPPRSSGVQMEWLRQHGSLKLVAAEAVDLTHPSLVDLKPGDLLFWARTSPVGQVRVHHVEMYLGKEKKDGRPVMIGSTDGRSYRGQKANGYGIHDFRVPKKDSASKLIGYGPPPGVEEEMTGLDDKPRAASP